MKPGLFQLLTKVAAPVEAPSRPHQEFLDGHFAVSPDWKGFKNKLTSKKFVEAVKHDPRADKKLQRYAEMNGKHMQAKGVPIFQVPSQSTSKMYTVKFHPDAERLSCNCGDWVHQRSWRTGKRTRDCKHIKLLQMELKNSGQQLEKVAMVSAASRLLSELKSGGLAR